MSVMQTENGAIIDSDSDRRGQRQRVVIAAAAAAAAGANWLHQCAKRDAVVPSCRQSAPADLKCGARTQYVELCQATPRATASSCRYYATVYINVGQCNPAHETRQPKK